LETKIVHPIYSFIARKVEKAPDGSLNAEGISNRIEVPSFPAEVRLVVVSEFVIVEADFGSECILSVHILHEDDERELVSLRSSPIVFNHEDEGSASAAKYMTVPLPLIVHFPSAEKWIFDVRSNGVSWSRLPYITALVPRHRLRLT
jgi:hypothetical protein